MTSHDPGGSDRASAVLLFSGGRDSSLAAQALAQEGVDLVLLTLTSGHLSNAELVHQRLHELKEHLPAGTRWIRAALPQSGPFEGAGGATCLPCQAGYVAAAARVAVENHATTIALGYTEYQRSWPEQTVEAEGVLRRVLDQFGLRLALPVRALRAKDEARQRLNAHSSHRDHRDRRIVINPITHRDQPIGAKRRGSVGSVVGSVLLSA